jgi:hypothetical protein
LSCVASDVPLLVAISAGGVVGGVTRSVGSGIGWLHNFVLSTFIFSHGLERGIIVVVTVVRSHRPTREYELEADLLYPWLLSSAGAVAMRM